MADESEKNPRPAVADRLKAMFKAVEDWSIPGKMRNAAERLDEAVDEAKDPAPQSKKTRRRPG